MNKVQNLPFAILPDEMKALERFHECATDGEGYDVSKEMMRRLAEIGLLRRVTANYYGHTTFGLSVLNGDFAASNPAPVEQAAPVTVPNGWKLVNESDLLAVKHALESCDSGDYSTGNVIYPSFDVQAVNESLVVLTALLAAAPAPSADEPLSQMAQDAKRYRYLRDCGDVLLLGRAIPQHRPEIFDATIDAALSAQKEGE